MTDRQTLTKLYHRIMRDSGGKMPPSQVAALTAEIAGTTPLVVGMTVDGVLAAVAAEVAAENAPEPPPGFSVEWPTSNPPLRFPLTIDGEWLTTKTWFQLRRFLTSAQAAEFIRLAQEAADHLLYEGNVSPSSPLARLLRGEEP